ncbi:MAG TPA: hypothetical protein EYG54_09425, partial [Myxococcales bacterium]|nr:hypothetical protein [Myxococcales bacterium]
MRGEEEPEMNGFGMQRTKPSQRDARSGGTRRAICRAAGLLSAFALCGPPAEASCLPGVSEVVSGDTVTCSGSNPAGFVVDVGIDAVTVVVEETATVSSLGDGIRVRNASDVSNHGQINVNGIGSAGIRGGNGTSETPALFENTATGIITLNSPGAFGVRVGEFTRTTNDGEI